MPTGIGYVLAMNDCGTMSFEVEGQGKACELVCRVDESMRLAADAILAPYGKTYASFMALVCRGFHDEKHIPWALIMLDRESPIGGRLAATRRSPQVFSMASFSWVPHDPLELAASPGVGLLYAYSKSLLAGMAEDLPLLGDIWKNMADRDERTRWFCIAPAPDVAAAPATRERDTVLFRQCMGAYALPPSFSSLLEDLDYLALVLASGDDEYHCGARAHAGMLAAKFPGHPVSHAAMGDVLISTGENERALWEFGECLRLIDQRYHRGACECVLRTWVDEGKVRGGAEENWVKVLETVRMRNLMLWTAHKAWRGTAAIRELCGNKIGAADAYSQAAHMLLQLGAMPDLFSYPGAAEAISLNAGEFVARALRCSPQSARAWLAFAAVSKAAGEKDDELVAFERAVACRPAFAPAFAEAAAFFLERGDEVRGMELMTQLRTMDPLLADETQVMRQLHLAVGDQVAEPSRPSGEALGVSATGSP